MPTDRTKRFVWKQERKSCAKGSFRVKKVGGGAVIRFCCPKGKWKSGYCHGGMKLQAVGKPKRRSR